MTRIEIGHHLVADTRVCGGRMIFRGTRVLVADALELLKAGLTAEQVAEEYRGLVTPKRASRVLSDLFSSLAFARRGVRLFPQT